MTTLEGLGIDRLNVSEKLELFSDGITAVTNPERFDENVRAVWSTT